MKEFDLDEARESVLLALPEKGTMEVELFRLVGEEGDTLILKNVETSRNERYRVDSEGNVLDEGYEGSRFWLWNYGWDLKQIAENMGYENGRAFVETEIENEDGVGKRLRWLNLRAVEEIMDTLSEIEREKREERQFRMDTYRF